MGCFRRAGTAGVRFHRAGWTTAASCAARHPAFGRINGVPFISRKLATVPGARFHHTARGRTPDAGGNLPNAAASMENGRTGSTATDRPRSSGLAQTPLPSSTTAVPVLARKNPQLPWTGKGLLHSARCAECAEGFREASRAVGGELRVSTKIDAGERFVRCTLNVFSAVCRQLPA